LNRILFFFGRPCCIIRGFWRVKIGGERLEALVDVMFVIMHCIILAEVLWCLGLLEVRNNLYYCVGYMV
jgi:hypothetical protein